MIGLVVDRLIAGITLTAQVDDVVLTRGMVIAVLSGTIAWTTSRRWRPCAYPVVGLGVELTAGVFQVPGRLSTTR